MCRPSALGAHTSCKLVAAIAFALLATASSAFGQSTQGAAYRDASRPVAERVRDLLGRMTLEEKFWQLFMIPGDLDDSAHDYSHGVVRPADLRRRATPPNAAARAHAERINAIQRYFVERTRLGIPIIPFEEAVHGLVRRRRDVVPAGDRPRRDVGHVARVARRRRDRARRRGAAASGRCCRRWSTSRTTCAGAASRRRTARIPCLSSRMARRVRRRVRACRRRRDAQAFRRQRRRRWARQLSDRLRARGCSTRCTFRRSRRRSRRGMRVR